MKRFFSLLLFLFANKCIFVFSQNDYYEDVFSELSDSLYSLFTIDDSLLKAYQEPQRVSNRYRSYTNLHSFSHTLRIYYTPNNDDLGNYLIITSDTLYHLLEDDIIRYAEDVHAIYGIGVKVESESNSSEQQLKDIILTHEANLSGVLFLGDLGEMMFEQNVSNDYTIWPCDLYFMDLDGIWEDIDENGILDHHSGNVRPEIFLGRLSASGMDVLGNEIDLLRAQLRKSHDYWYNNSQHILRNSLAYIDSPWDNSSNFNHSYFGVLYGDEQIDDIRYGQNDIFSKEDYLDRISSSNYSSIFLACHSAPILHNINDEYAYTYHIYPVNNSAYFYNLFCCSACNWTLAYNRGYLGGSYLFSGKTLAVVGSTKKGSMLGFRSFYYNLSTGKSIGGSLLSWWRGYIGSSHTQDIIKWFYGMTILGDPMINLQYNPDEHYQNELSVAEFPIGNHSNYIIYKAKDLIRVSSDFIIPQGVHVVFEAPNVIFESGFICPIGASIEVRKDRF